MRLTAVRHAGSPHVTVRDCFLIDAVAHIGQSNDAPTGSWLISMISIMLGFRGPVIAGDSSMIGASTTAFSGFGLVRQPKPWNMPYRSGVRPTVAAVIIAHALLKTVASTGFSRAKMGACFAASLDSC